ncbi:receptor-type tyrosine-protein phosphatase H isoform X1 [Linepithema humile]|uniref:receptor-type tyrosine-protein phosphatase H isoform X1 n=2 Tax=Linepithema humile TaxID=83485 RepID=UPI00351F4581
MILEKRSVLFVFLLYFPCSLCDDNASQEATNSIPHKTWNSGSMEKHKSNTYYDFASTESSTSFANDSEFADSFETSYNPESTENSTSYENENPILQAILRTHRTSLSTDPGSTENPTSTFGTSVSYNLESTENPTSYDNENPNSILLAILRTHRTSLSTDPGFTENPTSTVNDFESTDSLGNSVSYNFKSTRDLTNHASDDSGSTSLAITESGSTENPSFTSSSGLRTNTRDSTITDISEISSSISNITQSNSTTVIDNSFNTSDNTISTTIDPTINDPCSVNASDINKVINLKTENKSTEWITLSWELCINATDVNMTEYVYSVKICEADNNLSDYIYCSQTNETDTWYNATGLDPCTEYMFIVKILAEDWESDEVSLTEMTNNTISEIGDVFDLTVRNISVKTIQLAWQAPVANAKCISNYSIEQCDESSCNETTVVATNYTANDLNPCTEYHFTVKTVTQTVQSAGLNETAKTASPKLSSPESVHIIPGNFSLYVTWEPPKSDTNCIKHYHVSLSRVDPPRTFITTNTSLQIGYLHACATYEVHINAVNEDDVHGETATKSGTTNRSRTKPPQMIALPTSHATNITIIWSIDKDNNDCQLSAIITVCNYTERKGEGYDPVNNLSSTNVDEENVNKPSFTMNTTVSDLSAYTTYSCWSYIVSIGDLHSNWSKEVSTTTLQDKPIPPTFTIKEINNFNFSLTWEFPKRLPGTLEQCDIVIDWEPRYSIPDWCAYDEPKKPISVNCSVDTLTYDFQDLKPFTTYKVKMRAKTCAMEWSEYNEQNFSTKSTVPGAITKFNSSSIIIRETSKNPNVLETVLTWGMPCSLNGEFEFFNISIYGTRNNFEPHSFFKIYKCPNHMCTMILSEEEFHPKGEFNYTFTIYTKVKNIENLGQETSQSIQYPPGIPPQPDDEYINMITSGLTVRQKTTTTAVIFLPLFPIDNGDIKYYAIMVSEKGHNEQLSKRFDVEKNDWPNASSWKEAMMKEFTIAYQATRRRWDPYEDKLVVDYDGIRVIKYDIGVDSNCKEFSLNTDQRLYCNGPLKPDMWYDVRIRAFTYGGYNDSVVFSIKTNAELNIVSVIAAVFSILLMGILVTMMLLVRKCSPYILLRRLLHSDMPGSPVPAPFTRKKFINHCQELVDNPGKLSNEFRLLQTLSVDLQMPTNTACLQANRKKNRYSDILPYDFSRVKLEVIDNDPNTDYINASFIRGYSGEDEYIACQGPKEETTYDFWRMVDQYNINIIVMLTQLVEKGKEKCHQYYPTIRETFRYENMTIRCTSELDFRTHTQRTLILQKENKKRSITHLHFKDWPDHDVPEDFDAMINFCQIMRRNISANKDFIVVHCSAGIGRTGTLIAIDILLQHLRDDRKLDVFGTVYRLRHNRINMVQRESQYAYIYNCIKQVLKNPYFLKTCKPPPVSPVYQNISKKAKETTNSDNNLVNNLELLKKYNSSISMESLESIYNLFPWSTARNTINNGLRHYKSMGAINVKTHHVTIGRSRTLDRVFYKSQKDSSCEISIEGLQESFPLLPSSKSTDVLGDSTQHATDKTCERDD